MHHALAALHVADLQTTGLFAADAMIEQDGKNGAIAHTFQRIGRRRLEQPARLGIAERRG